MKEFRVKVKIEKEHIFYLNAEQIAQCLQANKGDLDDFFENNKGYFNLDYDEDIVDTSYDEALFEELKNDEAVTFFNSKYNKANRQLARATEVDSVPKGYNEIELDKEALKKAFEFCDMYNTKKELNCVYIKNGQYIATNTLVLSVFDSTKDDRELYIPYYFIPSILDSAGKILLGINNIILQKENELYYFDFAYFKFPRVEYILENGSGIELASIHSDDFIKQLAQDEEYENMINFKHFSLDESVSKPFIDFIKNNCDDGEVLYSVAKTNGNRPILYIGENVKMAVLPMSVSPV